jgi:uncharacterized membrane protein (UPF0182 family)
MGAINAFLGLCMMLKIFLHVFLITKVDPDTKIFYSQNSLQRIKLFLPVDKRDAESYPTLSNIINILYWIVIAFIIGFAIKALFKHLVPTHL